MKREDWQILKLTSSQNHPKITQKIPFSTPFRGYSSSLFKNLKTAL